LAVCGLFVAPLAQLVYPNAQFPRHLGLGFISNGGQPHGFKFELPGMVPAFLAFHDTALLRQLRLAGTVHETWVTSSPAVAPYKNRTFNHDQLAVFSY
jgi:hypothetical protein